MTLPFRNTRTPAEPQPDCRKPSSLAQPGAIPEKDSSAAAGVDLPGVGHVRMSGDVPEPLRSWIAASDFSARSFERFRQLELAEAERERLLTQLLFAAKELAEAQIEPARPSEIGELPQFCTECVADTAVGAGTAAHEPTCLTGRVLRTVSALCATLDVHPTRKETAADGEQARAGDGIRSRADRDAEAEMALYRAALDEIVECGTTVQCCVCGSSYTSSVVLVMQRGCAAARIVHAEGCWAGNALIALSREGGDQGAGLSADRTGRYDDRKGGAR